MPGAKSKASKVQSSTATGGNTDSAPTKPSWPALQPKAPTSDLSLSELYAGQIVTISRLWTSTLCKTYVKFLSSLPLTTTPGKPKRGEAVRVNDRLQIDDPAFAEQLWSGTGLKDLVLGYEGHDGASSDQTWGGQVLGLNPNIRIYRYTKGQYFDQHFLHLPRLRFDVEQRYILGQSAYSYLNSDDESNNVIHPGPPETSAKTTWTLLLYLTSATNGCVGGETVFYPDPLPSQKGRKNQPTPEPIAVTLETGMALLHKHGKDCMLHEGREVQEGEKWVIRSDLCVKR